MHIVAADPAWPASTGDTAALLRATDWSDTPLGDRAGWSPRLRATLELMFDSGFAMALRFGDDQRLIYNDAYAVILGERHPHSFGQPSAVVFHDVGDRFVDEFARVLAGETRVMPGTFCPLLRNGRFEDAWFDVSLSPYRDDAGRIVGTLSTAIETTRRVLAERRNDRIAAALRERESRLQQALEGADLGTWTWDPANDRTELDARAREILGLQANEHPSVAQMSAAMLLPAHRTPFAKRIAACVDPTGDGRFGSEHRVRRPDGREIWIRQTGQARFEGEGAGRRAVLVVGTLQDITARRQVDAAIREHQVRQTFLLQLGDRIRDLPDASSIIHATVAALGTHLRASRVVYAEVDPDPRVSRVVADWSEGDLPGLVGEHRLEAFGEALARQWSEGRPARIDDVANDRRPEIVAGRAMYQALGVAASICAPLLRSGRLAAMIAVDSTAPRAWTDSEVGLLQEVAERTREAIDRARAEASGRESDLRLASLVEGIPQLVWRALDGGVATWTSPQWSAFTGQSLHGSLGAGWLDTVHPDDREATLQAWSRASRDGVLQVDHRIRRADGEHVWHSTRARPLRDTDGGVVEWLGTTTDVQRLMELQQDKDRAVAQLAEADRRKDEFLATLAHELRNPLAPLTNAVHVIGLSAGDPARVEAMRQMIDRQLRHMVRLVDDLLDVSRISRGEVTLRRRTFDLAQAVRGAVETSRPLIGAQAHALAIALPDETLLVDADETRLSQAISNLLNNAAKYTPRGGHLHVAARRDDAGRAQVVVRDDGVGIPAELLPRMFEMFVQAPGARGKSQGGLGLGLAIARRMAEMHGGSLTGHSDGPGTGSTFVLSLPLATAAAPAARDEVHVRRFGALRVLVVDDNRDAADSMASLLKAMGHDARAAYGGRDGLAAVAAFAPEIGLFDIGMPDMDGHELARAVRASPGGDAILLVALTGWGQHDDRERSRAAGFDEHVAKPIDATLLERLLARRQPTPA